MRIKLLGAMHLKTEPAGYHLLREQGQQAINFVHFLSPVTLVIDGLPHMAERNACIIYTPGVRQEYYTLDHELSNNFVTFKALEEDILGRYNLPRNELFYIENEEAITNLVEYISWTLSDFDADHTAEIEDSIQQLLKGLEERQILNTPKAQRAFQARKRMLALRQMVHENPAAWTVARMAKAMYFTRSYFFLQYRALFGVPPSQDLAQARLALAKRLLKTSGEAIGDIAKRCGYSQMEYFIKVFKEQEGLTPGQYRRGARDEGTDK